MKVFPILWSYGIKTQRTLEALGCPRHIPWAMIELHGKQAYLNHSQSLERLAERGGLGVNEVVAVLEGKAYCDIVMTEEEAVPQLFELVRTFGRRSDGISNTKPGTV